MNHSGEESNIANLVPVENGTVGDQAVNTVNARDLHAYLEVGKDFSSWIKDRISAYGFTEDRDFVVFEPAPQKRGVGNRGVKKEYALTLDMAKELSMVERNERGKQARRYFIECERRMHTNGSVLPAETLEQFERVLGIVKMLASKVTKIEATLKQIGSQDPSVEQAVGFKTSTQILNDNGFEVGEIRGRAGNLTQRLRRFFLKRGHRMRMTAERGLYLFDVDGIEDWINNGGGRDWLIGKLVEVRSARAGQGHLKLVGRH